MCTRKDTLALYLGVPYLDDVSRNELTTIVRTLFGDPLVILTPQSKLGFWENWPRKKSSRIKTCRLPGFFYLKIVTRAQYLRFWAIIIVMGFDALF